MARTGLRALFGLAALAAAAALLVVPILGPCGSTEEAGDDAPSRRATEETSPDVPPAAPRPRAVRPAEAESPDDSAPSPAPDDAERGGLRVLCLRADTRVPIPNLRVEVRWAGRNPWGRTGPDGVWAAPRPPGAATVHVGEHAEVDGAWYLDTQAAVADGATEVCVLVTPSGVVSGVVVGPDGVPLPRVDVVALCARQVVLDATDSSGEFALRVPEGTRVDVEVRHFDGAFFNGSSGPVTATARGLRIEVRPDPMDAVLDVLVLDPDGRPAPGALVGTGFTARSVATVRVRGDAAGFPGMSSGTTGEDGRVRLTGLPRRPIGVRADAPTSLAAGCISGGIEGVAARGQQVTVSLRRGATIRGKVVDEAGEPGAMAVVSVLAAWKDRETTAAASSADIVGRFSVEVPVEYAGPYRVVAQRNRNRGEQKDVAPGAADLRIVIAPTGVVVK